MVIIVFVTPTKQPEAKRCYLYEVSESGITESLHWTNVDVYKVNGVVVSYSEYKKEKQIREAWLIAEETAKKNYKGSYEEYRDDQADLLAQLSTAFRNGDYKLCDRIQFVLETKKSSPYWVRWKRDPYRDQ